MKITTKLGLAKVAAIYCYLLHRTGPLGLIYSKTKIRYIFSFHSSFGVLISIFNMHVCMTYFFCIIKNNGSNVRCTAEGEKPNKCCKRNHTISFVHLRGKAQEYFFWSYMSLHF